MKTQISIVLIALCCWAAQAETAGASAARGRIMVQDNCSACHGIGRSGKSPLAKAPPLRTLAQKYPLENLEEAFAEGIVVSHRASQMPPFEMQPQTIADLIDYLKSLRPKAR